MSNNVSGNVVTTMASDASRNANEFIFRGIADLPRRDRVAPLPRATTGIMVRVLWDDLRPAEIAPSLAATVLPVGMIARILVATARALAGIDRHRVTAATGRDLVVGIVRRLMVIDARKTDPDRVVFRVTAATDSVATMNHANLVLHHDRKAVVRIAPTTTTALNFGGVIVDRVAHNRVADHREATDRSLVEVVPHPVAVIVRVLAEIDRHKVTAATDRDFRAVVTDQGLVADDRRRGVVTVDRDQTIRSEAMVAETHRADRLMAVGKVEAVPHTARNRNRGIVIQGNETGNSRYSRP